MPSNRATSPDKYIGLASKDRHLSKGEKRILLNVYGVLRKKERLSVKAAAVKAADLCGVSTSALFSAKNEFDKQFCDITLTNKSADPLGSETVQHDEKHQVAADNYSEPQPCNSEVCSVVKAKIFEMLGMNGSTTIESIVEAFQNDPDLPNLEDNAIRQVIEQLNLTSYVSSVASEPVELHQSNWDMPTHGIHSKDAHSDETGTDNLHQTTGDTSSEETADQKMEVDDRCFGIVCRETDDSVAIEDDKFRGLKIEGATVCKTDVASTPETILPDAYGENGTRPFEFQTCFLSEVKTEEDAVEREVVDADFAGIFPNRPTCSEMEEVATRERTTEIFPSSTGECDMISVEAFESTGNPESSFDRVNAHALTPTSLTEAVPFAGILVYGINGQDASTNPEPPVTDPGQSGLLYIGNVPADESCRSVGVFLNAAPESTNRVLDDLCPADPLANRDLSEGGNVVGNKTLGRRDGTTKRLGKRAEVRRYNSCNVCHRIFNTQGPFCQHLADWVTPGEWHGRFDPHGFTLTCRYCLQVFPGFKTKKFIQHTMFMHTMRSLSCDFCQATYESAKKLVMHVVNNHMNAFLTTQGQGIT